MVKRQQLVSALLGLTFLVYLPSVLSNGFVSVDDNILIHRNPLITEHSLAALWGMFTTFDPELYIPLTFITYKLEYLIFGATPAMFHLTNLLLHLGSTYLIFQIISQLLKDRSNEYSTHIAALIAAGLFALHPLNTEAVVWAAARKDVLSAFLYLLSYWLYLKEPQRLKWSIGVFALALMAKVSVLMLPVILILTDWLRQTSSLKVSAKRALPYFGLSALFGVVAIIGKQHQIAPLSIADQLLLGAKSASFYLQQFFWPSAQSIVHPQVYPLSISSPDILVPIVVLVALILTAIVVRKRYPLVTFGLMTMLLSLLPTFATFWRQGWVVFASDRYFYLAMFGMLIIIASLLAQIANKRVVLSSSLVVFLLFAARTFTLSHAWADDIALNRQALNVYPNSSYALNNLGTSLYEADDYQAALEAYNAALDVDPHLPQVHSNRGVALLKLGQRDEAIQAFESGIEATQNGDNHHDTAVVYLLLAQQYEQMGKLTEAFGLLEEAAVLYPENPTVKYNLAVKYQQQGRGAQAEAAFAATVSLDEQHVDAWYRFAAVRAERGGIPDAIDALKRVQKLQPGYKDTEKHLENLQQVLTR